LFTLNTATAKCHYRYRGITAFPISVSSSSVLGYTWTPKRRSSSPSKCRQKQ